MHVKRNHAPFFHKTTKALESSIARVYLKRMTLKQWMAARNITVHKMAKMAKVNPATISRLMRGLNTPKNETLVKIISITNGMVGAVDFNRNKA
jgi:predicted transcriptional regulator